ncbi:MAG: protein YgfX [Leucothrix sp.]
MILESPFSAPLRLQIPSSLTTLLMILVPLCFIAGVVLWYTPIHWGFLLAVVLVDIAVAYYFVRLHYWQNVKLSVLEINQDAQGQWSILTNTTKDDWQLVTLLPTSFISTFLIVLNFQSKKRRYSVILPADSLDKDTFRRLRVRIKVAFS